MSDMIHHGFSGHSKGLENECRFCLEAENAKLTKIIEERGYAFQKAINETLIENQRLKELALGVVQDLKDIPEQCARLNAENNRYREALTETQALCLDLRRTIDEDHWWADDLDRVLKISKESLEPKAK